MSATPKTIQIFLPGGDPQGIRVAEITTRIVQVIEVPRSLLSQFLKMPESRRVALYFLLGEADEAEPTVYIGQSGDLPARLTKHNKEKDFWERALVVISRTDNITQTHAQFLEWYCLTACRTAGRYKDENGNCGSRPHTPAPLEADCLEVYGTAKTLLATLGYPLFDPVAQMKAAGTADGDDENQIFYCKRKDVDARGMYTSEGFVLLKGSRGRFASMPSMEDHSYKLMREEFIQNDCVIEGHQIVVTKDRLFKHPSPAAVVLFGCPANGWLEWRNEAGRTLDEVIRQSDG